MESILSINRNSQNVMIWSRFISFIFIWLLFSCESFAQKTTYFWAFGDSAGIDFNNLSNPQPIETGMRSRGSCVSIADTNGNGRFYANTRATVIGYTTKVYNKLNVEMPMDQI